MICDLNRTVEAILEMKPMFEKLTSYYHILWGILAGGFGIIFAYSIVTGKRDK